MNWKNWKVWLLVSAVVIALLAIYAFAAPGSMLKEPPAPAGEDLITSTTPYRPNPFSPGERGAPEFTVAPETIPGLPRIRTDLLEPDGGTFESDRNLFAFVTPPPPPPPPPPEPPPPPPDRDEDGIPDFRDNCPDVANPDQQDIDRDGVGTACETEEEIAPPPPPPPLPKFDYRYLGTFGREPRPLAVFASGDKIMNVRLGDTFDGKFILRKIGLESVDIGFAGFPPERTQRIPLEGSK